MTGYQLTIGGVVMIVAGYLLGGNIRVENGTACMVLLYLVLISSVSFAVWSQLLKYNKVGGCSAIQFPDPGCRCAALCAVFGLKHAGMAICHRAGAGLCRDRHGQSSGVETITEIKFIAIFRWCPISRHQR